MEKEFIPYKQAKALKEIGFDEPCFSYYHDSFLKFVLNGHYGISERKNSSFVMLVSAPPYQQAFRWFREKHNTHSFIIPLVDTVGFVYEYEARVHIEESSVEIIGNYQTYEEAELACLIKLIEIVKDK